jgi:RNA polymerase sigma factor (sigma-70 family)
MDAAQHTRKTRATQRRGRDPLRDPKPLIRRVYAYVAYRVGAGPHAEDIISEVFERAVRYRTSYDASHGEPAAWLIGIARNTIADRATHALPALPEAVLETIPAPGDLESQSLLRLTLDQALARLSDRDQELLSLRFGGDLKARQIGELLELDTHAVEVALSRALQRLRKLIEPV